MLIDKLVPNFPYIVEKTFKDGPNPESGLFLGSKFPILQQHFEAFSRTEGADALTDKGVHGALLELASNTLLYVFNTHAQASGSRQVKTSQMAQIRQAISTAVNRVGSMYPVDDIAVILAGDLNINGYGSQGTSNSSSISFEDMISLLGNPSDLYTLVKPIPSGSALDNTTKKLHATSGALTTARLKSRRCYLNLGMEQIALLVAKLKDTQDSITSLDTRHLVVLWVRRSCGS